MPEKDPTTYSLITYAWVILLSAWGGIVTYLRKIRQGIIARFSLAELIGEAMTAVFSGILTFYLCEAAEIAPLVTAALVGLSGHMGSKMIYVIEEWAQKYIDRKAL